MQWRRRQELRLFSGKVVKECKLLEPSSRPFATSSGSITGNEVARYNLPIVWKGRTYPNRKALQEVSGLGAANISRHLKKYGNLDRMGVGSGNHTKNTIPATAKPIGKWPSAAHLARAAGMSVQKVQRWRAQGRQDKIDEVLRLADERSKLLDIGEHDE